MDAASDVMDAMKALREAGAVPKWGAVLEAPPARSNVFLGELKRVGVKVLFCCARPHTTHALNTHAQDPQAIGTPSVRNEASFLFTVVASTSLVAVVAGVVLPGDWVRCLVKHRKSLKATINQSMTTPFFRSQQGFFVPYLVGGISLGVLAVGSVAPGLLQFAIDKFGQLQPDYRERVLRHEAAHFLVRM